MEVFLGGNYILLRNPTKNFTATAFLHDVLNAGNPQKTLEQSPFYYNIIWLEAQHPAGLLSISCLSYNKRSNWLTAPFLGLACPFMRLSAILLLQRSV